MTYEQFEIPMRPLYDERQASIRGQKNGPTEYGSDSGSNSTSEGQRVPLVIASMLEGNACGSEIRDRVEEFGFGRSSLDTLYRTLRVMEAEGLIFSVRKSSEVLLSRWRFEPTEAGEAYLEFWAHSLAQYRKVIDGFLSVYEILNSPEDSHKAFRTSEGGTDGR